ncbi:MAG: hypothetical protein HY043_13150 [Verrucomicrobia bacterium]|nr:hypothetical protein [Verrucomicrobiota bacterium]
MKIEILICLLLGSAICFLTAASALADDFQGATHQLPYDDEVINYHKAIPRGPVAELQAKIDRGDLTLKFDPKFGYLPAMMDALKVPKSSQMLVFSKTSLQRAFISPKNPRAIYFNDDVYLGFIPGAPVMEVSAVDPQLGGIFYQLEQTEKPRPQITRNPDCLQCHGAGKSLGVPGHLVRSIATDETGELDTRTEVSPVTHRTPLADRWAGWYVTGTHGAQTHRGNLIGADAFERQEKHPNYLGNVTNLNRFFKTEAYLTGRSDIVALMVLEHQSHMHNYITRLNFETRIMLASYGHIRYLNSQVNAFLRYLLFTEEAPLTEAIRGDSQYLKDFASPAIRDRRGHSLRDFDLQTRLFKYPCSFLIYSTAFDQLPQAMRDHLLQRLHDILTGKDVSADFVKLRPADRQAVLEILRETKSSLPDYWKKF